MSAYTLNHLILWKGFLLIFFAFFSGCDTYQLNEANRLYHEGKYEGASRIYQQVLTQSKDSSILNYNLGTTLYKKGDYLLAMEYFTKALHTEDRDLEPKANYNIGNCKTRLGEQSQKTNPQRTTELYREALDYYQRASELNDQDEDAIYNYRWVEKKLRDLLSEFKQRAEAERSLPPSESSAKKESDQKAPSRDQRPEEKRMEKSDSMKPSGEKENEMGEISKEKATLILEEYRRQEEVGSKLKESRQRGTELGVLKDW